MNVSKILISNILGIQELEIIPGRVTRIEGKNGSGKTSCLEAIKAALKGGHDATLLRKGQEKGEVILVLENGMRIIKTVTETDSSIKLTHPENGKVSRPMDFIKQLADALAVNPIEFLEAKPEDRANYLLEAMPIEANTTEIGEIVAPIVNGQKFNIPAGHALKSIDKVYDQVFLYRQDLNRALKEKRGTIDQLTATLQDVPDDKDWKKVYAELATASDAKKEALRTEQTKMERHNKLMREGIDSECRSSLDVVQQEYQDQLNKLNRWREVEMGKIKDIELQKIDEEEKRFKAEWDKTTGDIKAEIGKLESECYVAMHKAQEQTRIDGQKEIVETMKKEAGRLTQKSEASTAVLQALDDYKIKLLGDLPIKNIEIKDGKVYRDGVEYERLNTAQQVAIAVDIAKIRAKELKLICLDGCECLDTERFTALEEAISKTDLQMIVTSVSDSELKITTK